MYRARIPNREHEFGTNGTTNVETTDCLDRSPDGLTRPARRALRGTVDVEEWRGVATADSGVSMIMSLSVTLGVAALWLSSRVTDTR